MNTVENEVTYPRKVKEDFLLKNKRNTIKELKEFVLFLMKNNGHTDIIEGVNAGEFFIKSQDGKQEKSILLSPSKLTTINYNGQYFKGWICHEDNMSPYPEDPIHNGEMYRKTIQKVAMNYRTANEAKYLEAKAKMWIYILIGGAIVLYVLYTMGKRAGWFAPAPEVTNAVVTATKSLAQIANSTGVMIK